MHHWVVHVLSHLIQAAALLEMCMPLAACIVQQKLPLLIHPAVSSRSYQGAVLSYRQIMTPLHTMQHIDVSAL